MTPTSRKILYAISFETLGVAVATIGLRLMSEASTASTHTLSTLTPSLPLTWSFPFHSLSTAWEARQTTRGRSLKRRSAHALLFEGGLVLFLVPIMGWWLGVSLWQALVFEAGLIVLFITYTYIFTWGFDRLFGLPHSAR